MNAQSNSRPPTLLARAIIFMLLTSIANALMALFAKLAAVNCPISLILFSRFLITLLIVLPTIVLHMKPGTTFLSMLKTDRIGLHLWRDGVGVFSLLAFFYATKYISLSSATVLYTASPLYVPIVGFFWQRVRIIKTLWWGMSLGFLGVIIMLQPGKDIISIPACFAVFAGLGAAIVLVSGRLLSYTEELPRTLFYYFFVGTIVSFIILVLDNPWHLFKQLHWIDWLFLIAVGICGYLYQYFLAHSMRAAPVRLTSPFLFTTTLFSIFIDWMVWGHIPNMVTWIGMLCIISGVVLMVVLYPHQDDYQKR